MASPTYDEIRAEVEAGTRVPSERDSAELDFNQLLTLQLIERRMLESMTPEQRLRRAGRGELSAHQRGTWIANYPGECPVVNDTGKGGVPPWIAATLIDIVEDGLDDD